MSQANTATAMVELMATGTYSKILLFQSSNRRMPLPNLYCSVNGYQVVIPREKEVVVSDILLAEIMAAAEGYEHEVEDPMRPELVTTVRRRRGDLNHRAIQMGITAQEAHEMRLAGAEVYPKKLHKQALDAIANLGRKSKEK